MAKESIKKPDQGVTREEFNDLAGAVTDVSSSVNDLVELIKSGAMSKAPTTEQLAKQKEDEQVKKAGPNRYQQNPDWEDIAREVIGEALDHTEFEYLKGGGTKFTVVIKDEFSNAPVDYLERYKQDRRSKEIGQEGEGGVKIWCELVRNNLKRPRNVVVE